MGRREYEREMKAKLRDLSFRIDSIKQKLDGAADTRRKVALRGELQRLELRRDEVNTKLQALQREPDSAWSDFKAEIESDWDALVQQFEEGVGRLS